MGVAIPLPQEPRKPDASEIIEDYLEHLIAPLVGTIPHDELSGLRSETAYHLQLEQEDLIEMGFTKTEAALQAIKDYGPAKVISDEFLERWFERKAKHPVAKRLGLGNSIAFSCFLAAQFMMVWLLTMRVYLPSSAFINIKMSPADIREFWPIPLPFPDFTLGFFLTMLIPVIAPFIAGWIVGKYVPVRASTAVYQGMTPILIYTIIIAALLLPVTEGLLYAVWQVVFWLPVGCVMAHISSTMARMKRMRTTDHSNLSSKQ